MANFTIHDMESAPEGARATLKQVESAYGFLPNLMGTMTESPSLAKGYLSLWGLFEQSTLTETERQVVLLAVSRENECSYCVSAHSAGARQGGVSEGMIRALRDGRQIADSRLEALRVFSTSVVRKRGHLSDSEVADFLAAGYTRANILEVILGVGLKTLSNYTNHIAGTPLDEAFEPLRWRESA